MTRLGACPGLRGADRGLASAAVTLLVASVLLGGAQGGQGQVGALACQWLALLLLAWMLALPSSLPSPPRAVWLAAALLALLPVLHLLPWPQAWAGLAGRESLLAELAAGGLPPPARLGLAPLQAERALWSLLPATALAFAVARLPARVQERLLGLLVALAVLSLAWGLLQRAQGPFSPLRLYRHTNLTDATGFFANRNHLASLLVMALPLVVAMAGKRLLEARDPRAAASQMALPACVAVLLVLGVAITRSRAGVLLCLLALALALPMFSGVLSVRGLRRGLALVALTGAVLAVHFGLPGLVQRMHRAPLQDARWEIHATTIGLARDHAPAGTGLGGFQDAYAARQAAPGPQAVNRAHGDWAELWLEGGWPGLALMLVALGGFARSGWLAWRRDGDPALRLRARACWVSLALVLLHSLVDYPLRTTALMAVSATLLAVLLSDLARLRPVAGRAGSPGRG